MVTKKKVAKKLVKKAVKKAVAKTSKPKKGTKLICLTCKRMNRLAVVYEGVCLTCKQRNQLQKLVEA